MSQKAAMGLALKKELFVPPSITIRDLDNPAYKLAKPLNLAISHGDSGYVLTEPETGVFSYHEDLQEALKSLKRALVSEYEFLQENSDHLAPSLQKELSIFHKTLLPRR